MREKTSRDQRKRRGRRLAAAALTIVYCLAAALSGCGASDALPDASSETASAASAEASSQTGAETKAEENTGSAGTAAVPVFSDFFSGAEAEEVDPADEQAQLAGLKEAGRIAEGNAGQTAEGDASQAAGQNAGQDTGRELGVWTVYWDPDGAVRTISLNRGLIDSVSIFAAYYPDGKTLTLPKASEDCAEHMASMSALQKIPLWLSVVNDTESEEKSVDLLRNLFADAEQTAASIVGMAEKYDCAGVEIDFEKLREDLSLWDQFIGFEEKLQELCGKEKLSLRVVLEAATPVNQIQLPAGPEYVVMCYNLHGSGTEPGPKADAAFLTELAQKFEPLGNVSYALANGGYAFAASGKAEQVPPEELMSLLKEHEAKPERDEGSGALQFDDGSRTVWYADARTLAFWAGVLDSAAQRTVPVSLWKL